jgi:hypothetical protein
MIKFFRHIRQRLLNENRFSKYFLYAIGEIFLVVIGILIALQINNWNNKIKDRKLEKQYISGLINDLEIDSISISDIKIVSDEQVRRKEKLYDYFEGQEFSNDSIAHFFGLQWGTAVGFNPVTTTVDEMTSTGGISVIQNPDVRKEIIKTYNYYQHFINGSQAYYERNRGELRKLAFRIPRVFDVESLNNATKPDIIEALKNNELRNGILANYAVSVNGELAALQEENQELLKLLNKYLSEL